MKIHINDTVMVEKGKDAGKKGTVEKTFPSEAKVRVTGVNMYKKHQKSKGEKKPGGIIDITKPLPVSNVILICPKCSQKTRVGYKIEKDAKKYRICKKCQQII